MTATVALAADLDGLAVCPVSPGAGPLTHDGLGPIKISGPFPRPGTSAGTAQTLTLGYPRRLFRRWWDISWSPGPLRKGGGGVVETSVGMRPAGTTQIVVRPLASAPAAVEPGAACCRRCGPCQTACRVRAVSRSSRHAKPGNPCAPATLIVSAGGHAQRTRTTNFGGYRKSLRHGRFRLGAALARGGASATAAASVAVHGGAGFGAGRPCGLLDIGLAGCRRPKRCAGDRAGGHPPGAICAHQRLDVTPRRNVNGKLPW